MFILNLDTALSCRMLSAVPSLKGKNSDDCIIVCTQVTQVVLIWKASNKVRYIIAFKGNK